jgi:hypothetical protein
MLSMENTDVYIMPAEKGAVERGYVMLQGIAFWPKYLGIGVEIDSMYLVVFEI